MGTIISILGALGLILLFDTATDPELRAWSIVFGLLLLAFAGGTELYMVSVRRTRMLMATRTATVLARLNRKRKLRKR